MVVGSLCVMPLENAGDFKTVLLLVQAPVSESATFNTLAQSILSSYTAPLPTLQLMLKPWDQIAGRTIVLMAPPQPNASTSACCARRPPISCPEPAAAPLHNRHRTVQSFGL